jgi:outer membrane murein-binding lipoprotein Lpp
MIERPPNSPINGVPDGEDPVPTVPGWILILAVIVIVAVLSMSTCVSGVPGQKPQLYIIHSEACEPCRNFDDVYAHHAQLRQTLRAAFELRKLDWDIPAQQAIARSWGVTAVPTMLVRRNGQIRFVHVGFTSSKNTEAIAEAVSDLMRDIQVDWPPARQTAPVPAPGPVQAPTPVPAEKRPAADAVAREAISKLASQSRDLQTGQARTEQKVEGLKADVQTIRSDISQLNTEINRSTSSVRDHVESTSRTLQESMERHMKSIFEDASNIELSNSDKPPVPDRPQRGSDISTEIKTGPTASKWWSVLSTLGRTGLAIAAPEVAIPGGIALTVAGAGLAWLRSRRTAQKHPASGQGTRIVPIAVDAPPSPQIINTETHFVSVELDTYQQAHAWAKAQLVRRYPGAVETVETLDSLISQFLDSRKAK